MAILLVKFTKHIAIQANKEKEQAQAQTNHVKTGIHLVMPFLHVTSAQSLTIRMTIIADLYNKYREWPGFNSIENQIDRTIYLGSGLRVPGSAKYDSCPRCNNDKNEKTNCPRCIGKGRCSIGRQYFAYQYLNSDGSLNATELSNLENKARMIKKCIVGRKGPSINHVLYNEPLGAPVDPKEQDYELIGSSGNRKRSRKDTKLTEDELGMKKFSRTKTLIQNAVVLKKVEDIIRRVVLVQFKEMLNDKPIGLRLDLLYSISTDKCYKATVRGECENWCSNLIPGEKHRSNRHYWEIRPHGLQQRCFAQSETLERRTGTKYCRDFYGRVHGLSDDEIRLLFPEHSSINLMIPFHSDCGKPPHQQSSYFSSSNSASSEDKETERQNHMNFLKQEAWGDIVGLSNKIYGGEKEEDKFDPTHKSRKKRKVFGNY